MTPDDPRHGSNAGYLAHYRDDEQPCDACKTGRFRARKRILGDKVRGEQLLYTADEVRAVVRPWLDMGISPSAIVGAAGYKSQRGGRLADVLTNGGTLRRSTFHAIAAVTEDDFPDTVKVYADLTRARINSLMAAGHSLLSIPINSRGQWRYRTHCSVRTAREVRAFYRANEFTLGNSRHTATRARNAGHKTPLAWDDPDTLAWPSGHPESVSPATVGGIDEQAIYRRMLGDKTVRLTAEESTELAKRWVAAGGTRAEMQRHTGVHTHRYLPKDGAA